MVESNKTSIDAKVIYSGAGACTILGVILLVAGVGTYFANVEDGEEMCTCPEGEGGDECCHEFHSLCDECWCTHVEASDGYCSSYEHTGSHGGAGIALAVAGLVVSVISAVMLLMMHWCRTWCEKNLHVNYPPVTPGADEASHTNEPVRLDYSARVDYSAGADYLKGVDSTKSVNYTGQA